MCKKNLFLCDIHYSICDIKQFFGLCVIGILFMLNRNIILKKWLFIRQQYIK
jgi:hypothetical protein